MNPVENSIWKKENWGLSQTHTYIERERESLKGFMPFCRERENLTTEKSSFLNAFYLAFMEIGKRLLIPYYFIHSNKVILSKLFIIK